MTNAQQDPPWQGSLDPGLLSVATEAHLTVQGFRSASWECSESLLIPFMMDLEIWNLKKGSEGKVVMKQVRTQGTERKRDNLELPPRSSSSFGSKLSGKII